MRAHLSRASVWRPLGPARAAARVGSDPQGRCAGGVETRPALALTEGCTNLKAKKILVGRDRLIEENGPLVRCIECVAHATRRDTGGPRDAVEGRAVEAASQAGSADRIWS